jgi:two-component system, cell cycle response regulator
MSKMLLIVEDNLGTLGVLKALFGAEGFEVETAESGERAIEKVSEKKYDLVILDLMLPQVDGFEVCRRIRADRMNAKTPVIILTAFDVPNIVKKSTDAGANDVALKPFDNVDLVLRVKNLLA